jgi:16S rRNA (uracil1498-N3)-methyltransferase
MIPSGGHLFFVDDLATPALGDDDGHHAARSLRLRDGEEISVGDGRGSWRRCRYVAGALEPIGDVVVEPPTMHQLCIGFALTKGAKPELVVQKLTELGIDRIVPFQAERSVVRWEDDRAGRAQQRLGAVARAAAMQSRRAWIPVVAPTTTVADGDWGVGAVLADRGGRALTDGDVTVLIGPEGGWSVGELSTGWPTVSLGDQVLRAETAAIAAGVVLGALRSGHIRHAG